MNRILFATVLAASVPAQEAVPPTPEMAAELTAWLAQFDAGNQLSGVMLVARDGEIVLHHAVGFADYEHRVLNTVDTRFNVASINKVLTGAMTNQLAREGKLASGDTLSKWVPGFPRGDEITVAHIGGHRAGFPHRLAPDREQTEPVTAADMVELARHAELLFAPGSQSSYSSGGYSVLARIIELADGRPFEAALRARVFEPAGMNDSFDPHARTVVPGRARAYVPGRGEVLNAPLQDMSFLVGAGSLVTTARDLYRLVEALRDRRVRGRRLEAAGARWTGASNGFYAWVDTFPEDYLVVIFCSNQWGLASMNFRAGLPALVRGEDLPEVEMPAMDIRRPAAELEKLTGIYESRPGSPAPVSMLGDELAMFGAVLLPQEDGSFFYQPTAATVRFVTDDDGRALALTQNGQRWPRVDR